MAFALVTTDTPRVPGALILFLFGVVLTLATQPEARALTLGWRGGVPIPHFTSENFRHGFFTAALPQIPVTTMNSVIALVKCNNDLYPRRPAPIIKVVAAIGVLDCTLPFLGGMPCCMGAGGLAAQHAFGARSNVSLFALGALKMLCAVLFGDSLLGLVKHYPTAILAAMLANSGLLLAGCARDVKDRRGVMTMAMTAGCGIAFHNTALGVAIGVLTHVLMHAHDVIQDRATGRALPLAVIASRLWQAARDGREVDLASRPAATRRLDSLAGTELP